MAHRGRARSLMTRLPALGVMRCVVVLADCRQDAWWCMCRNPTGCAGGGAAGGAGRRAGGRHLQDHDGGRGQAAGVSRTTVSFVLNNRDGARIPSQTRERVKQVAAELGYRPHGGARALASRRTSLIGLVSEIVTSPFAAATIRGIQDTVRAAGYTLFIVPTSTEATVDGEAFETLLKSRVEGSSTPPAGTAGFAMPAQAREIPTVLVHCVDPVSGLPCVRPDEEQMGRLAAQALLEGHHRDIGVIELDPNDGEAAPGRRVGCRTYLEQAGIPWSTVHVAVGHGTARDGYAAASRLLTDHPWLTGLVCGNDCMAMGAYAAIRERG